MKTTEITRVRVVETKTVGVTMDLEELKEMLREAIIEEQINTIMPKRKKIEKIIEEIITKHKN